MNPITVLVADDHQIVREGLLVLLKQEADIHDTASLTRYAISAGIIESSVQVTIL
jgi:DNA-binding NarL/FixJ family response regulator